MAQQAKPQGWNLVESNHSLTFRKRKTFLYEQRDMFTAVYERKQRTPKGKPHIFHCIEHLRTGKHQALGFYEAGGCGYELHISRCKRWYMTTNDYKVEAGEKIVTCPHQLFTDEVLSESRGVSSMIAASAAKYLQDELRWIAPEVLECALLRIRVHIDNGKLLDYLVKSNHTMPGRKRVQKEPEVFPDHEPEIPKGLFVRRTSLEREEKKPKANQPSKARPLAYPLFREERQQGRSQEGMSG